MGQLTRQRREWERADQEMTFQPSINELSRKIVQAKIAQADANIAEELKTLSGTTTNVLDLQGPLYPHPLQTEIFTATASASASSSISGSRNSVSVASKDKKRTAWLHAHTASTQSLENKTSYSHDAVGTHIGKYFKRPVMERLAQNLKPSIVQKSTYKNRGGADADGNASVSLLSTKDQEAFLDRNNKWHKQRHDKREQLLHHKHTHDNIDDRPNFHPKVGPPPTSQKCAVSIVSTKNIDPKTGKTTTIVERLRAKDELKQKRMERLREEDGAKKEENRKERLTTALPHRYV